MAQHTWEITGRVQHPAPAQLTQTSWVLSDGQEASHSYGRAHSIPPHTHQPTAQPGSRPNHNTHSRARHLQSHQTWSQTPGMSANDLPSPHKGKAWNKFVSKTPHDRHPWVVLHPHSTPVYHLWHEVMKGDLSWAQPVMSFLPCCSTRVENMYYRSLKVLTIIAANPVISTDVGKLLISLSLLLTMQKNLGFSPQLNKTCGELGKAFIPYSQPLM